MATFVAQFFGRLLIRRQRRDSLLHDDLSPQLTWKVGGQRAVAIRVIVAIFA